MDLAWDLLGWILASWGHLGLLGVMGPPGLESWGSFEHLGFRVLEILVKYIVRNVGVLKILVKYIVRNVRVLGSLGIL